jgi:hypothetical protein
MKLRSKLHYLVLALALAIFTTACNKKEECVIPEAQDVTRPVIEVITPANNAEFVGGSVIPVKIKFTDNKSLKSFKVEIHDAFDGHTHGKNAATVFAFDTVGSISGTAAEVRFDIFIPADVAAGLYHMMVYSFDAVGNEAEFREVDIKLKNKSDQTPPVLMITTPNLTAPIEATKGGTLNITGKVTDDRKLGKLVIELKASKDSHGKNNDHEHGGKVISKLQIPLSGKEMNITQVLYLPAEIDSDADYELYFELFDDANNKTGADAPVKFLP